MSKKEIIFHNENENIMGSRIQELRIKKGYDRKELHDLVYKKLLENRKTAQKASPENKTCSGSSISPESKYRTVYNWESGSSVPSYEILSILCDIFECDSDYLLGRQNNPLQVYDYIENITHFSRKAIDNIYDGSDDFLNVLNFIIENPLLIMQIQHCATVKYEFQQIPITQNANTPFRISSTDYTSISDEQLFQADLMNVYNILVQYIKIIRSDKGLKVYGGE